MRFLAFIPFLALPSVSECLAPQGVGMGDGLITVENDDPQAVDVLISDNDECVIGLNSSVESNTTRTFDIAEGAYFCIGKTGVPVEDGGRYVIKGGALAPVH